MAARSKVQVCGRSPAEILGSNFTGGMDACLLWALCVVTQRSLWRADHSSRGVLPSVVWHCVWSRNLANEEAMAHWGLLCQIKKKCYKYVCSCSIRLRPNSTRMHATLPNRFHVSRIDAGSLECSKHGFGFTRLDSYHVTEVKQYCSIYSSIRLQWTFERP